jgi:phospholipid/cholesterol/gamma-HCH transport system substrate-binding protein
MRITNDGVKLHSDAEAHIYWRTLLGFAFYIQLDPGASSSGLDGRTIPVSRTTTQAELDQVVTALTPPSREGIRAIFREFDKGFAGTGAGDSIDQLGPSMRNIGPGLNALRGTQTGDLSRTVKASSRLMGALARNEVELGGLVDGADTTLGVTAARRADLGQILSQGPATLSRTRATMVRLRTTLDRLDPVVEQLRPGARVLDDASRALRPAMVALRPVLRDARPLLSDLRPALRSLGSASKSGVPLLTGIDPSLNRLTQTIIPGLEARGATKLRLYEAIGPVFATVSESAALFDAYGHTQRFQAVAGGAKSLGLLPCTPELATLSINCADFQKVVLGLLGQSPKTTAAP